MEDFETRYLEVMVNPEQLAAARALNPLHQRPVFGRSVMVFENIDREKLARLGEVRRPSIADVFVAIMSGGNARNQQSQVRGQPPSFKTGGTNT
jgi:ABC-2 type transport system ATP-binding protein